MTERVLIIGGSANDFGRETEGDVAAYQVADVIKKYGHEVVVVDDNPYAFTNSRHDIQVIEKSLTVDNLMKVIDQEHITAMVTSVGGSTATRLGADILKLMGNGAPRVLGLSLPVMQATQNTKYLHERLMQLDIPTVQSRLASNISEAFDAVRDFELPIVIRPVAPMGQTLRLQVTDMDDVEDNVQTALNRSITHQVNIDKSIRGYQEISMLVLRDKRDTAILIGGVEDLDPVGIHSADSIAVTPIQTLPDPVYQKLRATAFKVIRGFDVVGMLEVRFAVDPKEDDFVITRVTPYFDRTAALLVAATGYPLVPVATRLLLGENLEDVQTPVIGANHTALLEPTMDHIVIRFPIFSFGEFESNGVKTEHRLNTVQKSVGTTIGVGRSVEEALEKAIRAAHFNNRNFSPTIMSALTDNEIIEQLIHPRDNRIFVLLEALRRGYTVDELAEMTKINAFYFYKLKQINKLEETVKTTPWQMPVVKLAKYYGLSDGLIARLWDSKYEEVRRYRWDNGILPTYKAFEPSAGEFEESANQYYSTFESENESTRLGTHTALVIGAGGFRLGDGAAASYVMAMVVAELQAQGIPTVLMNNSPTDLMFMPKLGNKKYYEPLEISDVMNVIEIEQPTQVFVPGNRIKLINSLRRNGINVQVIAKEKYLPSSISDDGSHTIVNYFYDGQTIYLIGISNQSNEGITLDQSEMIEERWNQIPRPQMNSETPGLYQMIIKKEGSSDDSLNETPLMVVRPMPFTMVAFLDKVTGIDWMRLVVRYMLNRQTHAEQQFLAQLQSFKWRMPKAQLTYWHADFEEHMEIYQTLDNGRYAIGATYHLI